MAYRVTSACLKCGYCVERCPEGAIIPDPPIRMDEWTLQPVHIDVGICNDCGICVSTEYWCPAGAIVPAEAVY